VSRHQEAKGKARRVAEITAKRLVISLIAQPVPKSVQKEIDDFYRSSFKEDCEGKKAYHGGSPRKPECELLTKLVLHIAPQDTLDWGLGDGAACMAIVLARRELGFSTRHVSLDPFQYLIAKNVGLIQLQSRGLTGEVDFREDRSEEFLTDAIRNGRKFDFMFIDGDHSAGAKMTDAYLADRATKPGGVIAFHDALFDSTAAAVTWLLNDRKYELIALACEPPWKRAARCARHVRRLGISYARRVIPHLGISIAALRKS